MMNQKIMVVLAIVIIILVSIFYVVPLVGLSLLDRGTDTKTYRRGIDDWAGNYQYELLPKRGYILSYMNDGHSEEITVRGSITKWNKEMPWSGISKVKYVVYLKENVWSPYKQVSIPGAASTCLSNPNPGNFAPASNYPGYLKTYQFTIIGNDYADGAIKVELWAYFDLTPLELGGPGQKWYLMASDEAYLYSGYGSLMLPTGIEDGVQRPHDTFEIGQTVDIEVETAKGGYADSGKPWRVTLNEPYSGGITEPGSGGGVVKEEYYENDVTNGHFKFVVTAEMAQKSMASDEPYSIRIWNTLLPKGTLYVDYVDFIANCPSDVTFQGQEQSKVGETATVQLSTSVNSNTQAEISYFRVSVIYGTKNVLLPSDPTSFIWLIRTTNIPASGGSAMVSFTPTQESYVTVHAKAFDVEGRGSLRTETWTLWAYNVFEAPEDVIEDEVGQDDYGGGHTSPWLPWEPGGGNWGEVKLEDYLPIIVAIAVFVIMLIIALMPTVPIPYGMYGRIAVIILGALLAILIYLYLGGKI